MYAQQAHRLLIALVLTNSASMMLFKTVLTTLLLLSLLLEKVKLEVSKTELSRVMQTLWDTDSNRLMIGRDIRLNLQGRASLYSDVDRASGRSANFFKSIC